MNNKLNFLLRTALSAATEDRDSFIEKFSAVLEDYTGLDKQTGTKAGSHVVSGLSALKEELQAAALNRQAAARQEKVEELAAQLAQINERLDEIIRELNTRKA
ncbi:MAG: hypothetical protein K2I87_08310 [Bacteroidales bacterium]|nr:hypothetical protein [Bacteroidales bacterium]